MAKADLMNYGARRGERMGLIKFLFLALSCICHVFGQVMQLGRARRCDSVCTEEEIWQWDVTSKMNRR